MDLPFFYCMFMLSCFDQPETTNCPSGPCSCFRAPKGILNKPFQTRKVTKFVESPKDGIIGDDAMSMVCNNSGPNTLAKYFAQPFKTPINTLVLNPAEYLYSRDNEINYKLPVTSIVLVSGKMVNGYSISGLPSKLDILEPKALKYIAMDNMDLDQLSQCEPFSWERHFKQFRALEGLYIANSPLVVLNQDFAAFLALNPGLRSLKITNCDLYYIEKDAFNLKSQGNGAQTPALSLKQLDMSNNQINTLQWLTSLRSPLKNLITLDLSRNHLITLPENLNVSLPALQDLNLVDNPFRFFTWESIQPWAGINQACLMTQTPPQYFQFSKDMLWILDKDKLSQMHALYLGDLITLAGYQTNRGDALQHHLDDSLVLQYYIDQVQLDASNESLPRLVLYDYDKKEAHELSFKGDYYQSCTLSSPNHLSKCLTLFMAGYNHQEAFAYKINVFEHKHLDYLQIETSNLTDLELDQLYDDLEEFLDMVYYRKQYVLLTLWPTKMIDFDHNFELFVERVPRLLSKFTKRIASHPALIGIDMGELSLPKPHDQKSTEKANECRVPFSTGEKLHNQLIFFNLTMVQLNGIRPVGVSVAGDCTQCFQTAANRQCLPFEGRFDFINIINNHGGADEYSYHHSENISNWYHEAGGEPKLTFFTLYNNEDFNSLDKSHLVGGYFRILL